MLNDDAAADRRPNTVLLVLLFLVVLLTAAASDSRFGALAARLPQGFVRTGMMVSDFGLSGYMFALSGAVALGALWFRSRERSRMRRFQLALVAERAIFFFSAIAASGLLAQAIKHLVGRSRPKLLAQFGVFHFDPLSLQNVQASFPSGHTTSVFAAAVALSFIFPGARVVWFALACAIGASRIVVGAHYPSDVVGGAALGAGAAYLTALVFAQRAIAFDPTAPGLRVKRAALAFGAAADTGTGPQ